MPLINTSFVFITSTIKWNNSKCWIWSRETWRPIQLARLLKEPVCTKCHLSSLQGGPQLHTIISLTPKVNKSSWFASEYRFCD